jgi:hypothetical protein
MHSKQKGNIGQLAIAKALSSLGFSVFAELGDLSKVDLIAIDPNYKCIKIQVKSISSKNGRIQLDTRKFGPNYKFRYESNQVDVFAVYVLDRDIILYLNAAWLLDNYRSSILIRLDPTKSKQIKNCVFYNQFLNFEEALKNGSIC